jgi:hypothetical protein
MVLRQALTVCLPLAYDYRMATEESNISGFAAKGGAARAKAMTPGERSESARRAAIARWGDTDKRGKSENEAYSLLPRETHAGSLKIGDVEIPCSVLDNNVRVFSIRGINRAMGYKRTGTLRMHDGAPQLPGFLAASNIKAFVPNNLAVRLISPLQYRPKHAGNAAMGYEATLLAEICEVLLDARKAGVLREPQLRLATTAETFIRGFARVGVIALVDEATGYQEDRAKDELAKILAAYISPRLMPWTQKFPHDFFKQVYRLHGWAYKPGTVKHPQYLGKFINKYVYGQFPPGVLEELQALNPVTEFGYRRYKHPQLLTVDTGHATLDRVLTIDITLMQISETKKEFDAFFDKALGKPYQERLPLVLADATGTCDSVKVEIK